MALPGITTVLRDQFAALSRTDNPPGRRVLAIATRDTSSGTGGVEDFDPYVVTNEQYAIDVFGENSQCHRAYSELVAGGASTIIIVALPSGTVDSDLSDTESLSFP